MVKPGAEYYNLEKVAEVLSVSTAEVNRLREQSKIRGFRDGSNWKFLKDDILNYYAERSRSKTDSTSGQKPGDSDFDLAGDNELVPSFDDLMEDAALPGDSDLVSIAPTQPKSDLDLAALDHDSDLALAEETKVSSIIAPKKAKTAAEPVSSVIVQEEDYEDSSAVLQEKNELDSSAVLLEQADVDSSAVLLEQADVDSSAVLLEQADVDSSAVLLEQVDVDSSAVLLEQDPEVHEVELDEGSVLEAEGSSPQLGLAGDSGFDILLTGDEAGDGNVMQLDDEKTEATPFAADDFELEPSQILMADDNSESSSQVIAIDVGLVGEAQEDGPFGGGAGGGGDDFDFMGFDSAVAAPPAGTPAADSFGSFGSDGSAMPDEVFTPPVSVVPKSKPAVQEEEYSTGMLVALVAALVLLLFPGIMMIDNMIHIWSWNEPFPLNSMLMDGISGLFGL